MNDWQEGPALLTNSRITPWWPRCGCAAPLLLHMHLLGVHLSLHLPAPVPEGRGACLTGATPRGRGRTAAVLRELRAGLPRARIVLQALLPRGMDLLPFLRFAWPNRGTAALRAVNAGFAALADEAAGVHYVDCGRAFVERAGAGAAIARARATRRSGCCSACPVVLTVHQGACLVQLS